MTARTGGTTPAPRAPARREADGPAANTGARPRPPAFDAHLWLERYRLEHADTRPSDRLSGVPFN